MSQKSDDTTGTALNPKPKWDTATYDDQWKRMAERGIDPHGEVAFLQRLEQRRTHTLSPVLDAGCGTGRVAIELSTRGYPVEGTDVDTDMLDKAAEKAPQLTWHLGNLATQDLGARFATVIAAGNIILFVDDNEKVAAVAGMARHLLPGGYLVAGMQLKREDGRRVAVDDWCAWSNAAGLVEVERFSTWNEDPFPTNVNDADYIVTVFQKL